MELPSPVNSALSKAAVTDFFAQAKWQKIGREYDWCFSMLDPLTIIVTVTSPAVEEKIETFTLRITCDFYPVHPPDVRFVNPKTLQYDPEKDKSFVANLQAPYCHTHLKYDYQDPYKYGPQLVCSSMTLGYYFSRHNPTPDQAWNPVRHCLGSTIYTIQRALNSSHYKGRHS